MGYEYNLYMVVDRKHNDLPMFVGTMKELEAFTGMSKNTILSQISHRKKEGKPCKYIHLGKAKDIDNA